VSDGGEEDDCAGAACGRGSLFAGPLFSVIVPLLFKSQEPDFGVYGDIQRMKAIWL